MFGTSGYPSDPGTFRTFGVEPLQRHSCQSHGWLEYSRAELSLGLASLQRFFITCPIHASVIEAPFRPFAELVRTKFT
jgi:hypothetical protein